MLSGLSLRLEYSVHRSFGKQRTLVVECPELRMRRRYLERPFAMNHIERMPYAATLGLEQQAVADEL